MKRALRRPLLWLAAVLVGLVAGLGLFTFKYAEGLSYFSTDPRACANCHIMNDEFASWTKGPHHGAAGCVDCHLPHDFVGKYMAKAQFNYPFVKLGKQVVRLSVGSRIYNEQNMIIMPVSAPASADVLYKLDMNGEISQIWILTPEESKATAAALKKK